jgi:hypothetical protein
MGNVQFEENTFGLESTRPIKKTSFITRTLISSGIVKDEKTANIVLIAASIVFLALAIFIFFRALG